LKVIGDAVVAFLELMETEGRSLRSSFIKILIGIVLVLIAGIILVGGFAFLLWSVYLYLKLVVNPPTAALMTSAVILILGGALLWSATKLNR